MNDELPDMDGSLRLLAAAEDEMTRLELARAMSADLLFRYGARLQTEASRIYAALTDEPVSFASFIRADAAVKPPLLVANPPSTPVLRTGPPPIL